MKASIFIFSVAALLALTAPILIAAEALSLESSIYVFKHAAFHEILIPTAKKTPNAHALIFKSPATAQFDQLTLFLENSHISWGGSSTAPDQFSLVATPPVVPITLNKPVKMASSSGVQFLEQTATSGLHVRDIPADSPDAPHILLSFTISEEGNSTDLLQLTLGIDIATVVAREKIPGIALDVGKPKVATFKDKEIVPVFVGQRAAILLDAPNGSDYSMLLLLRLARPETPNTGPIPRAQSIAGKGNPASQERGSPVAEKFLNKAVQTVDQTLYVVVDNIDEAKFEHARYSRVNGQEIIMTTLKTHAAELASAANWKGSVTVLDYDTPAPVGARVLLLTWDRGEATLVRGKDKAFLGVVSTRQLAFHPDHERIIRQIVPSTRPDEHYDSLLRARTEMDLFVALQLAAEHEK